MVTVWRMTYAPGPVAPRQRPASVTVAVGLMFGLVVLLLVSAVVSFLGNTPEVQRAMDNFSSVSSGSSNSIQKYTPIISAIFGALFAVVIVVLAVLNLRGNNGARITTWVLGGLGLLCCGLGTILSPLLMSVAANNLQGDQKAAYQRLMDSYPGWYRPTSVAIGVLELLVMLGVVVFLALPASNAFFRKPVQEWVPPGPVSA